MKKSCRSILERRFQKIIMQTAKSPISENSGLKSVAASLKLLIHHLPHEYVPFTGYLGMLPIGSSSDGFGEDLVEMFVKSSRRVQCKKFAASFHHRNTKDLNYQTSIIKLHPCFLT